MQDQVVPVLTLVALALVLWLLLIRPAQRRNRELAHLRSSLEVGDEVMLTSGVYGVLRSIDERDVRVEVADGVVLRVARGAVGQILTDDEHDDEHDQHDDEHDQNDEHRPGTDADGSAVAEEN